MREARNYARPQTTFTSAWLGNVCLVSRHGGNTPIKKLGKPFLPDFSIYNITLHNESRDRRISPTVLFVNAIKHISVPAHWVFCISPQRRDNNRQQDFVIKEVEQVSRAFTVTLPLHQRAEEAQTAGLWMLHHSVGMHNAGFRRLNAQNYSVQRLEGRSCLFKQWNPSNARSQPPQRNV